MRPRNIGYLTFALSALLSAMLLMACGEKKTGSEDKALPHPPGFISFSGILFKPVAGVAENRETGLSGQARFIAKDPLPSMQVGFGIKASLEANQVLKLIAFADKNLSGGLELWWTTNANGELSFQKKDAKAKFPGAAEFIVNEKLDNPLEIDVDLHMDHGHGDLDMAGKEFKFNFDKIVGRNYWGFEIDNATVESLHVGQSEHKD